MAGSKSAITLACFLAVIVQGQNQNDLTRVPGTMGTDVVEATVSQIRDACVFPNDHNFLRRLAYVMSTDGKDPKTYRLGFDGGIWQVSQNDFELTKTSALVSKYWAPINTAFNINWAQVQWSDLRKPLYSGIAALLTLLRESAGNLPRSLELQALFFQNQTSPGVVGAAYNFRTLTKDLDVACATDFIDLAFLVDTSVSLSPPDFERAKLFASDVIGSFNVGLNAVRVAFVTFSTGYRAYIDFKMFNSALDVQNSISNIQQQLGATNTHLALKFAAEELFTALRGSRSSAGRIVVLITDGQSDDRIDAVNQAKRLKDSGVTVFVIGVGDDVNKQELDQIASQPACTHVQVLKEYAELDSLKTEIKQVSCRASVSLAPGTYSYPCGQQNTFQVAPTPEMTIIIRPKSGYVRFFASYSVTRPNEALREYEGTATPSIPAAIYITNTNSPVYITVASDPNQTGQCGSTYEVEIVPTNALRRESNNACVRNAIFNQCSALDVLRALYQVTQLDPNNLPFPTPCMPGQPGYYPHPYSIDKFIYCDGLGNIYLVNCAPGYYYRSTSRSCVVGPPPTQAPTQAPVTTPRPTAAPTSSPTPFPIQGSTGQTINIDPGTSCSVCTAENYRNGLHFFAYAGNETLYIMCTEYEYVCKIKACAEYHKWSQLSQACVYSDIVIDWTRDQYQSSPDPLDYQCQAGGDPLGIYFHPHPTDNTKYIQCDEFGDAFIKTCPDNEIWNQNLLTCVPGMPITV